jgi:hypothetical protein
LLICTVVIVLVVFLIWKVWTLTNCQSCKGSFSSSDQSCISVQGTISDNVKQRTLLSTLCNDRTMTEIDKFIETFSDIWPVTFGIKNYTDLHATLDTPLLYEIEIYCHGIKDREDFDKWYRLFLKLYPNSLFDVSLVKNTNYFVSVDLKTTLLEDPVISKINLYESTPKYPGLVYVIERTWTPGPNGSITYRGEYIMGMRKEETAKIRQCCEIMNLDYSFVQGIISSATSLKSITIASKGNNWGIYLTQTDKETNVRFLDRYQYPSALKQHYVDHMNNSLIYATFEIGLYFKKDQKDITPQRTGFYMNFEGANV